MFMSCVMRVRQTHSARYLKDDVLARLALLQFGCGDHGVELPGLKH